MLTQNSTGRQIIQITLSNSGGGSYSVAIQCSHLKATSPAKFSWAGCLQTVLLLLLRLQRSQTILPVNTCCLHVLVLLTKYSFWILFLLPSFLCKKVVVGDGMLKWRTLKSKLSIISIWLMANSCKTCKHIVTKQKF